MANMRPDRTIFKRTAAFVFKIQTIKQRKVQVIKYVYWITLNRLSWALWPGLVALTFECRTMSGALPLKAILNVHQFLCSTAPRRRLRNAKYESSPYLRKRRMQTRHEKHRLRPSYQWP